MTARSAEEQIRELARDLAPVRRIPPLGAAAAAAVALCLVGLAAEWLLVGSEVRPGSEWRLAYAATLAGILLVALGALLAALAAAIPGREATVRLGTAAAAVGLALTTGGGLVGLVQGAEPVGTDLATCLGCAIRVLTLGVAPVLLACGYLAWAALRRPGLGAVLALAGGVALGAAAVHATCPIDSPHHWLLAHALAPAAAAAVLAAPLAFGLARWTRRARPAGRQ